MPIQDALGLTRLAKPLSADEGRRILERDQYRCQYCGLDGMNNFENSLIMTVDFVQPRARKGAKAPTNLVAACRPCNLIKGNRVFDSLDEARAYVVQRRSELFKEWDQNMNRVRARTATATE